jgi:hypothetical protein
MADVSQNSFMDDAWNAALMYWANKQNSKTPNQYPQILTPEQKRVVDEQWRLYQAGGSPQLNSLRDSSKQFLSQIPSGPSNFSFLSPAMKGQTFAGGIKMPTFDLSKFPSSAAPPASAPSPSPTQSSAGPTGSDSEDKIGDPNVSISDPNAAPGDMFRQPYNSGPDARDPNLYSPIIGVGGDKHGSWTPAADPRYGGQPTYNHNGAYDDVGGYFAASNPYNSQGGDLNAMMDANPSPALDLTKVSMQQVMGVLGTIAKIGLAGAASQYGWALPVLKSAYDKGAPYFMRWVRSQFGIGGGGGEKTRSGGQLMTPNEPIAGKF